MMSEFKNIKFNRISKNENSRTNNITGKRAPELEEKIKAIKELRNNIVFLSLI